MEIKTHVADTQKKSNPSWTVNSNHIPWQQIYETSVLQTAPAYSSWQQPGCLLSGPYRGSSFSLDFLWGPQVNLLDIIAIDLYQRLKYRLPFPMSYTHLCCLALTTSSAVLGEIIIWKLLTGGFCSFPPTAPTHLFVSVRRAMRILTLPSGGRRHPGSLLSRPLWN